jgi:hypothetical protein
MACVALYTTPLHSGFALASLAVNRCG